MKNNASINHLARPGTLAGKIRFIHFRDGQEHTFYSCINDLSGSRLSAFDNDAPGINDSLSYVKGVFAGIRAKAIEVLEVVGDF
jgi:hypothetical protein